MDSKKTTAASIRKPILGLVGWLVIAFATAAIAAVASVDAGEFYFRLVRPGWAPPSFIFGPVWTILYALMGISAWLIWRNGGLRHNRLTLSLFMIQLVPNALWSWLFFAWHEGGLAFADLVLLWTLATATALAFWRSRPLAGVLISVYLLWVTFAGFLNYSIWQLNPQILH